MADQTAFASELDQAQTASPTALAPGPGLTSFAAALQGAGVVPQPRSAGEEIAAGVRRFGPSLKQTIAATSAGAQEAAGKPVDATTQAALDQSKADLAANAPEPTDQHNWLVRAVAGAPQAIASFLPMAGAQFGGALAGPVGGAAAVGAQQYAQRYHEALGEATDAKKTPDEATAYAQKEAQLSGALGAGFGLLPVVGPVGRGIAKAVGLGAAKTAAEVGTEAVAKKAFLPTLATKALEGQAGLSAYSAAQAVGSNVNKQEAGLPSTSAGEAAMQGLQGSLEGGLAFAPFWALHARGDVKRTAFAQDGLDNVQTAQPKRLAAANQVYAAMAKADKPAADVWRKNAAVAIDGGRPVGLTPDWFTGEPDYLKPPEPTGVETGTEEAPAATAPEQAPAAPEPPPAAPTAEQPAQAPEPPPQPSEATAPPEAPVVPPAAAVTPENVAKAAQLDQTAAAAGTQGMPFSEIAKAAALDGTTDAVQAKNAPPAPEPDIPPEVTEAQDSADDIAKRNRKEAIKASEDALKFDKDNPPDGGFIAKVPDNIDTLQGMADETQAQADALRQSDAPRTALLDAEVANFKKRQDDLRATLPKGGEDAVQKPETGSVLQRESSATGEAGGERGRVEQGVEGTVPAQESEAKKPEETSNSNAVTPVDYQKQATDLVAAHPDEETGQKWKHVQEAADFLMDDRSHGDEWMADASRRVYDERGGEQYGGTRDVRDYVAESMRRADVLRAQNENPPYGGITETEKPAPVVESPVDKAAHEAASSPLNDKPEPTQPQVIANNAPLGHTKIGGLDISIENPEGSTRSDKNNTPPQWSREMTDAHYGYIRGTEGKDGDHLDVFVKPGTPEDYAGPVFVVDQTKADGKFDESKSMIGYPSQDEAVAAYKANYPPDFKVGPVAETTMDGFKDWTKNGDTTKPFGDVSAKGADVTDLTQYRAMSKAYQQEAESLVAQAREHLGTGQITAEQIANAKGATPFDSLRNLNDLVQSVHNKGRSGAANDAAETKPAQEETKPVVAETKATTIESTGTNVPPENEKTQNVAVSEAPKTDVISPKPQYREWLQSAKGMTMADASKLTLDQRRALKAEYDTAQAQPASTVRATATIDPWQTTRADYIEQARSARSKEADAAIKEAQALPDNYSNGIWNKPNTIAQIKARFADRTASNLLDLRSYETGHRLSVERAIAEGKSVPPEVLADYPRAAQRVRASSTLDSYFSREGAKPVYVVHDKDGNVAGWSVSKAAAEKMVDRQSEGVGAGATVKRATRDEWQAAKKAEPEARQQASSVNPMATWAEGLANGEREQKLVAPEKEPVIAKPANTEDAGAELAYNRRNRIRGGITWSDIADKNPTLQVKETNKQNVYPKPDYEALVNEVQHPTIAHIVKQIYDAIAAKPQTRAAPTAEDMQRYIAGAHRVMDGVMKWARDADQTKAFLSGIGERAGKLLGASRGEPTSITSMIDRGGRPLVDAIYPDGWKAHSDEIRAIGGNKLFRALQPGTDEVIRGMKAVDEGWPASQEAWQKRFFLDEKDGKFHVMMKVAKWRHAVGDPPDGFASKAAAEDFARSLTKRENKPTISDKGISVESAKREGPEGRMEGEDVSSDKLKETFGFKGVNFGNWMKGEGNTAERQLHLNHAYDSMHDLAELLNVPPKAVSLDGMLGVAVGAQGSGHYAAHFVPGLNEINLTRTSGAGSLAHEWAHALDHYFATQAGLATRTEPFLTEHVGPGRTLTGVRSEIANAFRAIVQAMNRRQETPEQVDARMIASKAATDKRVTGWLASIKRDFVAAKVDPEKFDAIADDIKNLNLGDGKIAAGKLSLDPKVEELRQLYKDATGRTYSLDNIKGLQANVDHAAYMASEEAAERSRVPQETGTQYAKDAAELDAGKGGKQYWSTNLEKFARAFDAYISDKLEATARKNTYLSHAGRDNETVPRGAERAAIDKAFDTLVGEIKTKETEKGTALYDRGGDLSFDATGMHAKDVQRVYDQLTARFKGRPEAVIAPVKDWPFSADSARIEQAITVGGKVRGAYWKGKVYLDPEAIATKDAALFVVKHELAHSGLAAILKPASLKTLMERIYDTNDKVKALADVKMKKLGYDKALAAEEAIADMAGRGEWRAVKGWPALFAQIRMALRKLWPSMKFTDDDVAALISKAQKAVEEGKAATPETNPPNGGFKQSLGKSKVVDAAGEPLAVRGTGTDMHFAAEGKGEPSYLAIKNPKRVPDQDRANNGDWTAAIARAKAEGRDGLVYRKADGKDAYVAFREDQVRKIDARPDDGFVTADSTGKPVSAGDLVPARFSIGTEAENEPRFTKDGDVVSDANDDPKPINPKKLPPWMRSLKPETVAALQKASFGVAPTTIGDRIAKFKKDFWERQLTGIVDQYLPILKRVDAKSYWLSRMTGSFDTALLAGLRAGKLFLNDAGAIDLIPGSKGWFESMKPLQGEGDRFLAWIAGNRAEQLTKEDREHLFKGVDIDELKSLNRSDVGDKFPGGKSREAVYAQVLKDHNGFGSAINDIAQKSGIINAEARKFWEKEFYVPNYRNNDDASVTGPGAGNVSGLVNQYAFKTLKGGTNPLSDLTKNVLMNWSHLLSASLKNQAATSTLENAEKLGIARRIGAAEKGSVFTLADGKQAHWMVDDGAVLDAIKSLDATPFKGPAFKALGAMKHYLTVGTTLAPPFRVKHFIREQVGAMADQPTSYDFIRNIIDGFNRSDPKSFEFNRKLAGGAYFNLGYDIEHGQATYIKSILARGIDPENVVDSPAKYAKMLTHFYDAYVESGERSDRITRANVTARRYAEGIANGESPAEAHFWACTVGRDTLDYGLRGQYAAIRMLRQVVPFLGARLGGLYKLGRGAHEDPKRFLAVTGAVTLSTIALSLAYRNDPDMAGLEDWDKDSSWIIKIGKTMYRIPKPFEIGALASIIDRATQYALNGFKPADRERFARRVIPIVASQLNINPIPQAFFPAMELWANNDLFTGRMIESQSDQRLHPAERFGPGTSMVARLAGKAQEAVGLKESGYALSPKQLDFLINSYFGFVGTHVALAADFALRPLMNEPSKPTRRLDQLFVVGNFAGDLPPAQSQFVEDFYTHLQRMQESLADVQALRKEGRPEEATERSRLPSTIAARQLSGAYQAAEKQMSFIDSRIKFITMQKSQDVSPEQKRVQIDRLTQQRNEAARRAEALRDAAVNR